MALRPTKPQKGDKVLQSLYNTVCDIVDYLPSLEVRGDNKTISVSHSTVGTTIKAVQPYSFIPSKNSKGEQYTSGRFIRITSGNAINCILTGGTDIEITPAGVINYTGSGGGPGSDTTYTGEYNVYSSGWISVDSSGSNPHLISSNLRWIKQLYNDLIVTDKRPLSSWVSAVAPCTDHFMQFKDWIGNKGQNTIVTSGSFINTHTGAGDPGSWEYIFQYTGPQVDCLLTGGRFIDVHSHWQDSGGETPEETEPDDHTINSLLSGDNQHIFIKELTGQNEINANGSWGGIISTNIHGDETTIHMADDGTLSLKGSQPTPTPGGGGMVWPNYANLDQAGNQILLKTDYTAPDGGGWLRVSVLGATSHCCALNIDGHHIGMYNNPYAQYNEGQTFIIPIPPSSHFYVNYSNNASAWFDGNTTFTNHEDYETTTNAYAQQAYDACMSAKEQAEQAKSDWDDYHAREGYQINETYWYQERVTQASGAANIAKSADSWAQKIYANCPIGDQYSTAAYNNSLSASSYAASAVYWVGVAHDYYLSAVQWWDDYYS